MQAPYLMAQIPDVVWAALLASGLTLLGVMLSNWGNTRRLVKQLSHDSVEKDKDRINALRKDVYLRAAEEAAKVNSYLGKIPQLDPSRENIGDGLAEFLGVAAKLQLVSQPKTSRLTGELVTRYGEIMLTLLAKATPVHNLNADIRIAGDFYDRNHAEVLRALAEMKHLNESGEKNPHRFEALELSIKHARDAADHFHSERSKAYAQHAIAMRDYTITLFQEIRSVARLQMQLSAAIRSELNLATDMVEYESRLQENFERMDKAVQQLLSLFHESA